MLRLAWNVAKALGLGLARLPRAAAEALGGAHGDRPRRPRRLMLATAIILPLALFARWAVAQVTIVMSPSIEAWAVQPDPGPIERGDYVMFTLSHRLAGPKPVNVTKHALCLPGETLAMIERRSLMAQGTGHALRDGYYYCNGRLLGVSKPYGRGGQRLEHLHWAGGPIPAGMAYVGSANPNSFDSRYFGPVPLARLTRMRRIL